MLDGGATSCPRRFDAGVIRRGLGSKVGFPVGLEPRGPDVMTPNEEDFGLGTKAQRSVKVVNHQEQREQGETSMSV